MPRLKIILLALAVMFSAGLAWHYRGLDEDPATPWEASPSTDTGDAGHPPGRQAVAEASTDAGVPALEAPLPDAIAELLARAEAGDARAACDLGSRLIECSMLDWYAEGSLGQLRDAEREAAARGDHVQANAAANAQLSGMAVMAACAQVPRGLRARAFELTRMAALGGEPEAIVRYAIGQALADDPMKPYAFFRLPRFDTWRSEAPALLEALEQSGDPQAVLALLDAQRENNHFALLLPPDPVKDTAYLMLARRLFGDHPALANDRGDPQTTPSQRAAAESLAEKWHRERFSGKRFRLEDHTMALAPALDPGAEARWPQPSDAGLRCFAPLGAGVQ